MPRTAYRTKYPSLPHYALPDEAARASLMIRRSEAIAQSHTDQHRVHLEGAHLGAGGAHVRFNEDLLHVEIQRPVLVQRVVETDLQRAAETVLLDRGVQRGLHGRVEAHARKAGVVHTGADVGLEGAEIGEVVLRQQRGRQVLEAADLAQAVGTQVVLFERELR